MTKRRYSEPPAPTRSSRRLPDPPKMQICKPKPNFAWKSNEWATKRKISDKVSLLSNNDSAQILVVKKVLRLQAATNNPSERRPIEVRVLALLPSCNRVAGLLSYAHETPGPEFGIAFFEYHPMGDLLQWKVRNFDNKNFKPVPESHIWRFFVQTSQALAFIHNEIGLDRGRRQCFLHRDLKPQNFLVTDNGTTYPSFKLHDFDCATQYRPEIAQKDSRCGTFNWQPPENPKINTTAADIWSLGACVHFLAIGAAPIQSVAHYTSDTIRQGGGKHPAGAADYSSPSRYYSARVPREVTPINLSRKEQCDLGIAPYQNQSRPAYNYTYSDELNDWMEQTLDHDPNERPSAMKLISLMTLDAKGMLRKLAGQAGLVDLDIKFSD